MSWRNPGAELGKTTWDDYLEHGAMKAIEVALAISGADKVNALGWCVGGTILSSALAVLRARGDKTVANLTLLTTMLDFREPGDRPVSGSRPHADVAQRRWQLSVDRGSRTGPRSRCGRRE